MACMADAVYTVYVLVLAYFHAIPLPCMHAHVVHASCSGVARGGAGGGHMSPGAGGLGAPK